MFKYLVTVIGLMLSLGVFSQVEIIDLDFDLGARHIKESENDRERIQNRIRMGFTVSLDGKFELVGIASTGPNFDSSWGGITDSNGNLTGQNIVFRNIYIQKTMGSTVIEAGALPYGPVNGNGGQSVSGWIDGVRVQTKLDIGQIKVVAGSIGNFQEPNAFKRKLHGNFIEIELEREIFEDIISNTAVQIYNGEVFIRQNVQGELKIIGDRVITYFAGVLFDVERGRVTYDIGGEIDVLKSLFGKYNGHLKVQLFYSYVDERIPNREDMLPAFHTYGHRVSVHVSGKIDKKGRLNWYYRSSVGENKRNDAGITLKIPFR